MKKISLFPLALIITFCLGSNLQAKKVQEPKAPSKTCMYVKRALGIGFGACALAALGGAAFKLDHDHELIDDKKSVVGSVVSNTLGVVAGLSTTLKENLPHTVGLEESNIIEEVVPVALAAALGFISYKLLTSCSCSKVEAEEAEEATA